MPKRRQPTNAQHCCRLLPFGSQARSQLNAQAATRRLQTNDTDRRDRAKQQCAQGSYREDLRHFPGRGGGAGSSHLD